MSSALLLRLFTSEHFDVHRCVAYLGRFIENVGISYYLVGRLAEFDAEDLEFYWPQLCHLLVTRPTDSAALETYILQRCEESTHVAMLTHWYLQASLSDLQRDPNTPAFATCRRVFNLVQHVIFSDRIPKLTADGQHVYDQSARIQPHGQPALIGLSLAAMSIGAPRIAQSFAPIAIQQSRRPMLLSAPHESDTPARRPSSSGSAELSESEEEEKPIVKSKPSKPAPMMQPPSYLPGTPLARPSETLGPRPAGSPPAFRPRLPREASRLPQSHSLTQLPRPRPPKSRPTEVQVTPATPPAESPSWQASSFAKSAAAVPSLGLQSTGSASGFFAHSQATSASVPVLPLPRGSTSQAALSMSQGAVSDHTAMANSLPRPLLVSLLRARACRAELDLLATLQDISTRLIAVPKLARVSALRAELTVLNHGLPRGCCLSLFCPGEGGETTANSTSTPFPAQKPDRKRPHHRVVRIAPSESVVLNSADRAPFLIHVEILSGDVDFEPARRQNAEDLRIVLAERESAIARQSYRSGEHVKPAPPTSSTGNVVLDGINKAVRKLAAEVTHDSSSNPSPTKRATRHRRLSSDGDPAARLRPAATEPPTSPPRIESVPVTPTAAVVVDEEPEEMDLVEQLYGNRSMRETTVEPEESNYLTPVRNRTADEEAWRRADQATHAAAAPYTGSNGDGVNGSVSHASNSASSASTSQRTRDGRAKQPRPPITLEEYAERMRMAAIMLSQLNASQQPAVGPVGAATGLVGAGYEAVKGRLPFARSTSSSMAVGQGSAGVTAKVDTAGAATGLSAVQGMPEAPSLPGIAQSPASMPRQRVLPPAEAAAIRERIMTEMMALEAERMARMKSVKREGGWTVGASADQDEGVVRRALDAPRATDDPSGAVFREAWAEKKSRIRAASPYGHLATWDLLPLIVKTGADLRQEQLATQLIREFDRIWYETKTAHWLRYFRFLVTSESTGIMETITDSISVHSVKKDAYAQITARNAQGNTESEFMTYSLFDYFVETFGEPHTGAFRRAQDCFLKSLASYSIVCYLLQIKDRHNGNILVDNFGHVVHIDFGFMLSNSPGGMGFEMAPFKLAQDYLDILGGPNSTKFGEFRTLMKQLFKDVRRHAERIIVIVELMQKDSTLPCFSLGEQTAAALRSRFQLGLSATQCDDFVDRLIDSSTLSVFTRLYDQYQALSQGIL